jgi:hypothetical protein
MMLRAAIADGVTALRRAPGLLVGGLLLAAATGLGSVNELVDLGVGAGVPGLAWALALPFALGGFVGMTNAAIRDGEASLADFWAAGRANYAPMFVGTLLFLVVLIGVVTVFAGVGFLLTLGSLPVAALGDALGLDGGRMGFGFGVASFGLTVALVFVGLFAAVCLFQFYPVAIVVEGAGPDAAFARSASLVRANLPSAAAFTVGWLALSSTVVETEFLVRTVLPGADPPSLFGVAVDVPLAVGLPVVVAVAAVGFAALYAVQTAFFLRLAETDPATRNRGDTDSGQPTETDRPPGAVGGNN